MEVEGEFHCVFCNQMHIQIMYVLILNQLGIAHTITFFCIVDMLVNICIELELYYLFPFLIRDDNKMQVLCISSFSCTEINKDFIILFINYF